MMIPTKALVTITCTIFFGYAIGDSPMLLTSDKSTALSISQGRTIKVNLLDCQLRVESKQQEYRLIHSGGEVTIPRPAVKRMQDRHFVEVALRDADLYGMPVRRIWLAYKDEGNVENFFNGTWRASGQPGNQALIGNAFSILIEAREVDVVRKLGRIYGSSLINSSKNSKFDKGVVTLRSNAEIPNMGGYKLDSWPQSAKFTQLDYQCVIEGK